MKKHLLMILWLCLTIIMACTKESPQASNYGYLAGKVSIGPLCPVETNPPDPNCLPDEETYKAWPVSVWSSDKKDKIAQINVQQDGIFVVNLKPGSYVVALDNENRIGSSNLPQTVSIVKGRTTTLNIEIDTGIR